MPLGSLAGFSGLHALRRHARAMMTKRRAIRYPAGVLTIVRRCSQRTPRSVQHQKIHRMPIDVPRGPPGNKLLAALPEADRERLLGLLHRVELSFDEVIHAPGTVRRKEWRMTGPHNPIGDLALPRVDDARSRRTSNEEVAAICEATESKDRGLPQARTRHHDATGELHALRWENVDLRQRTAWLPPEVTKTLKGRKAPLSTAAVTVLKGIGVRKSGAVFHYDPHTSTRAWRRAATRARSRYVAKCEKRGAEPDPHFLVDTKLHDLRHEGASR